MTHVFVGWLEKSFQRKQPRAERWPLPPKTSYYFVQNWCLSLMTTHCLSFKDLTKFLFFCRNTVYTPIAIQHRPNIIWIGRHCRRFWSDPVVDQGVYIYTQFLLHLLARKRGMREEGWGVWAGGISCSVISNAHSTKHFWSEKEWRRLHTVLTVL